MLVALDIVALLGGIVLVAWSGRGSAPAPACERAGGAMVIAALIGLGFLLARAGS